MHRIMTIVLLLAVAAFVAAPTPMFAEDQPHMQAALECFTAGQGTFATSLA